MDKTEQAIQAYKDRIVEEGKFLWSNKWDGALEDFALHVRQEGFDVTHIKRKGLIFAELSAHVSQPNWDIKTIRQEVFKRMEPFAADLIEVKIKKTRVEFQFDLGLPVKRERVLVQDDE